MSEGVFWRSDSWSLQGARMAKSNGKSEFGAYTATNLDRETYWPEGKLRISITGAGGFIASHIARRLKSEGHYIIASDWKKNEHMSEDMFCDEFHLVDLRVMDNCLAVTKGAGHVFNLAADMGGMGFIQSNHSVIMYNNTMISFNMLEAARINGVKRSVVYHLPRCCEQRSVDFKNPLSVAAEVSRGDVEVHWERESGVKKILLAYCPSLSLTCTVTVYICGYLVAVS